MLEVLSLNSLLSVGVSHETMKSNALLGSNSCDSWGWEFSPKGWVETISSQQLKSQSRQLQPLLGHGQRMILVFHLRPRNGAGALLELAVLSFNGSWHWLDLGLTHELPALTGLRPAVSVDLGAAVRVLSSEVFLDSGCQSCGNFQMVCQFPKDGKSDVEDELPGQFLNVRFFFGNQVIQQYP